MLKDPVRNEYTTGKMIPGIYMLKISGIYGYKVLKLRVLKK
jgi:hypothetical protein